MTFENDGMRGEDTGFDGHDRIIWSKGPDSRASTTNHTGIFCAYAFICTSAYLEVQIYRMQLYLNLFARQMLLFTRDPV